MMADKIKMINVADIIVGVRFREDMGDIDTLVESIRDKGVIQPITVNQNMELIAGGRRTHAAKLAGLTKIPALVRDQTSMENGDIDLREIELIENTVRKDFTWSEHAKLVAELHRMCSEKTIHWSARKTAELLGESHPMNTSRSLQLADAIAVMPEIAKCKTQDEAYKVIKRIEETAATKELRKRQGNIEDRGTADMIKRADCNYIIGDALVEMGKLSAGQGMIGLIEVDPPYGIDLDAVKAGDAGLTATYQEIDLDDYEAFIKKLALETYRVASAHCWMVFWYGPTHHHMIKESLLDAGWLVDDIPAIWMKNCGQTLSPEIHLARVYEPFFVCRKGKPVMAKRGRANVFQYNPLSPTKKIHPTERPIELIEEIIATFGGVGTKMLIPFLGSGATLRAAYNMGCPAWGYDINGEYKDAFLLAVEADVKKLNGSN